MGLGKDAGIAKLARGLSAPRDSSVIRASHIHRVTHQYLEREKETVLQSIGLSKFNLLKLTISPAVTPSEFGKLIDDVSSVSLCRRKICFVGPTKSNLTSAFQILLIIN